MRPIKITENVYRVGATDWNLRDFHGYATPFGSTYNSYLVMDEKITLIDNVKAPFADVLLHNISQVVDPAKIDQVINNHTEPDHSGSLPEVMRHIGMEKPVYCSKMGEKNLPRHFPGVQLNLKPVGTGDVISTGKNSLHIIETKMLHWPDNMFCYMPEQKLLFSNDAFGQHYAGPELWADELCDNADGVAKNYYANILWPFSPLVTKLVADIRSMQLDIAMILPSHGLMWRQNPGEIIQKYSVWAAQKPLAKAVVVYDTMWESTRKMAEKIRSSMADEGILADICHVRKVEQSEIMTEALEAAAIVVGSPTINNQMFPTIAKFLCYLKGLKPQNKIGAAFGSYGWSGEGVPNVEKELAEMKMSLPVPGLKMNYYPDDESYAQCDKFGRDVARAVKAVL